MKHDVQSLASQDRFGQPTMRNTGIAATSQMLISWRKNGLISISRRSAIPQIQGTMRAMKA
jgi:hypothetical protein